MDPVIEIFYIISEEINLEEIEDVSPESKLVTPGGTPAPPGGGPGGAAGGG